MTWKVLGTNILILLVCFFVLGPLSSWAAGIGECSSDDSCKSCPVSDCSASGGDPDLCYFDPPYNTQRVAGTGMRVCEGDHSCASGARCVKQRCSCGDNAPIGSDLYLYGHIFLDNNGDGFRNEDDKYIRFWQSCDDKSKSVQIGADGQELVRMRIKNLTLNQEERLSPYNCLGDNVPFVKNTIPIQRGANYEVGVEIPPEYYVTTRPNVIKYDNVQAYLYPEFGIAIRPNIICNQITGPSTICSGKTGTLSTVFSGNMGRPLYYKWESGCLNFINGKPTFDTTDSSVSVSPLGSGSCSVRVSASVDQVNYVSCLPFTLTLEDCAIGCGATLATPSLINVGDTSSISITPSGRGNFEYTWSSSDSACNIHDIVSSPPSSKLTAVSLPAGNSCVVNIKVKEKISGNELNCPVRLAVVDNSEQATSSWFKTVGGDVLSLSSIIDYIPSGIGEFFSTYFVKSKNPSDFDSLSERTGAEKASRAGWYITGQRFSDFLGNGNFFSYFTQKFPAKQTLEKSVLTPEDMGTFTDALVSPSSNLNYVININDEIRIGRGGIHRYYINGDLNINKDIVTEGDSIILFVVKGNLNISSEVKTLSGAFLVDGNVNLTNKLESDQLSVYGMMGVSSKGKLFGNYRDVGGTGPSEVFTFEPKYLVKLLSLFDEKQHLWVEVAP
jgi:hypothetical protein